MTRSAPSAGLRSIIGTRHRQMLSGWLERRTSAFLPSVFLFELPRIATPYHPPLQQGRARLIEMIEQDARSKDYPLFDGPCVRLANYRVSPRDSSEKKHLELTLGRMTGYDYVLTNQRLGDPEMASLLGGDHEVTDFVDFDALARERNLGSSQLSNILTAYLTATTTDGFLIYSERSGKVASHRHLLISAVSENLHPEKDGVFGPQPANSLFFGEFWL